MFCQLHSQLLHLLVILYDLCLLHCHEEWDVQRPVLRVMRHSFQTLDIDIGNVFLLLGITLALAEITNYCV
jgi:hypothetical protein